jgi:transcription termination factor Rho
MMADGYGFLHLLIIIIWHHQMIFIYRHLKWVFGLKTGDTVKGVVRPLKRRSFSHLVKMLKINGHDRVVRDRVSSI